MPKKEEKLRLSPIRIIMIFLVMFLIFEVIFYFSFQGNNFFPLNTSFYVYTPALLGVSALFCFLTIKGTYFVIQKERIVHVKMNTAFEYRFKDIIYIDEEYSVKHKTMLFYLKDGKERFLAFDKDHKVYDACLERCENLITKEELKRRFPNLKIK